MNDETTREPEVESPVVDEPGAAAVLLPRGVNCCKCLYELEGLLSSSTCPECATPIPNSLRSDALIFASPEYLRRLRVGAEMATWGAFAWVALSLLGWALASMIAIVFPDVFAGVVVQILRASAAAVILIGVWRLTTADDVRSPADHPLWVAPAARWVLIGSYAAIELTRWVQSATNGGSGVGIWLLASLIACAVGWSLMLRVVAGIYRRGRVYRLVGLARTASGFIVVCACVPVVTFVASQVLPMLTGPLTVVAIFALGALPVLGIVFSAATLILTFIVMVELGAWIAKARARSEAIRSVFPAGEFAQGPAR